MTTTPKRALSLDALRGYAIVTMILSGTVASGVLPGWMYHAQLPPPSNIFNPSVYGITWVDLVFPFFLFAMGAAFPFSIGSKLEKGVAHWRLILDSVERGVKLTFFAIFIQHLYPWVLASPQDPQAWLTTLCGFVLMFPMFMRLPWKMSEWSRYAIQLASFALGIGILLTVDYANDRTFSLSFSNIIILLLANMALFGSLIYLYTFRSKKARLAILPFIMAVFLGSTNEGSWTQLFYDYTPAPWFYKFYYMKYLFIVLPGSIAGEYLRDWLRSSDHPTSDSSKEKRVLPWILLLSLGIIVWNLYGLYMRYLVLNLTGTALMLFLLYRLTQGDSNNKRYWHKLFTAGAYLLMLGLFFEAYEGGIRKDTSTYSYYFVTTGLAFIAMIALSIICDVYQWKRLSAPFVMAGQNPMIAYVATNMLVMPLIGLLQLTDTLNLLNSTPWGGFLRGVIVTTLSTSVAIFFTRIKWFWRT